MWHHATQVWSIEYIITDTGKQFFKKDIIRLEEMLHNAEKMKEASYEDNC